MQGIKESIYNDADGGYGNYGCDYPDNRHLIAYYFFQHKPQERVRLMPLSTYKLQSQYKEKTGKDMTSEEYNRSSFVESHIVVASLFATTIPVGSLSLQVAEPEMSYAFSDNPPCKLSPKTVSNTHGLTVYDLFRAGANWKYQPGGDLPGTQFFGVSLDKKTSVSGCFSFQPRC